MELVRMAGRWAQASAGMEKERGEEKVETGPTAVIAGEVTQLWPWLC